MTPLEFKVSQRLYQVLEDYAPLHPHSTKDKKDQVWNDELLRLSLGFSKQVIEQFEKFN